MKPVTPGEASAAHEALAEVKPIAEHERLADVLHDIANIIENSDVSVIATDGVFEAAQTLHYWLAAMVPAAERHRQANGKPVDLPAVVRFDEPDLLLEHGDDGPSLRAIDLGPECP